MTPPQGLKARLAAASSAYFASLAAGAGAVPDELYLALLDVTPTQQTVVASRVVAFHRDVGNGGLCQAVGNLAPEWAGIEYAYGQVFGPDHALSTVLADGVAVHRRSTAGIDEQPHDAWDRYMAVHAAAQGEWDALDARYYAEANAAPHDRDMVECGVIAYAARHPEAFAAVVAQLIMSGEIDDA